MSGARKFGIERGDNRMTLKANPAQWLRRAAIALAGLAALTIGGSGAAVAQSADGRYELVIPAGQSEVLEVPEEFSDLMLANPEIADVLPLTTTSVYIVGKQTGSTVLTIYGEDKELLSAINIVVSADVNGLKARIFELMPDEPNVSVSAANESIVLSGRVSSGPKAQRLVALAESYAPGNVVNMLSVQGTQQVMLSVRFVEMERSIAKSLRANTSSAGIPNGLPFEVIPDEAYVTMGDVAGASEAYGIIQSVIRRGDFNVDILVDALETRGFVRTLAEPTLVAMSGDTASFLAGGEFPIPVALDSSGDGGNSTITIEFKQFGISLAFTPTVLEDGVINLVVSPEVSSIDPTASVVTNGLLIPGLKVNRATTTVEMRDGESFTIAGLLREEYRNNVRQFPFLGDLPVVGALFRSTGYQQDETELVIIVTPHLASPVQGQMATPGERFVPPSDFELFVFGAQAATPYFTSPEDRALMGMDPTQGGLEGGYGHVLH
jgi:pilus assembly protein CpaC